MERDLERLNQMVCAFPLTEGEHQTGLSYLSIHRTTGQRIAMPRTEPCYVYVVLDGSIRLHTPGGILDYVPGQYSISRIDTPTAGYVLSFSRRGDFLALSLALTLQEVVSVLLELDGDLAERIAEARLDDGAMASSDRRVIAALCRLFEAIGEPEQLAFLGKHIRREIVFSLLCGSCGSQFLRSVVSIRQAGEIYEINSWMKENFRQPFTVEELAERWNMSVSQFHQKFKSAVGMGPLQCQKRLRLTEARRLMLDGNRNVTEAALEVGYESVSQFTRDYRNMFETTPKEDILRLRGALHK